MNTYTTGSRRRFSAGKASSLIGVGLLVASLGLAGCAADSRGSGVSSGGGSTIKVGGICDATGPTPFPESCQAAKAYFDQVNSDGGVNGHTIEYSIEDGGGSAATSTTAAARLVNSKGVEAFVGGASLSGCVAADKLLTSRGVYSLEGFGADNGCWTSTHIMPMNTGSLLGYFPLLHYVFDVAKDKRVCVMIPNTPAIGTARSAISTFERSSGHKITAELLWNPGGDLTPLASKAKSSHCDGDVLIGVDPVYVGTLQAAKAQKSFTGAESAVFSTGYTATLPKSLGANGNGLTASSEFEPWSGDSASLADFRKLQAKEGFPLSTVSEGGYLSAKLFVDAVKGIKGDVTTASIGKALSGMKDADTGGLTATPMTWGRYNIGSKFVEIRGGSWTTSSDEWYSPELTTKQARQIAAGRPVS
ncbi:ABC transporter substrate-binding protein [Streptomyces sp. NPDC048179]|uniref:ABC transporter substrate-binding protein n=1 Tax=Streptomyces sp. NPDC048179 TaxID=3365506 RepID=UPI003713C7CC